MSREYTTHLILRKPVVWGELARFVPNTLQAVGRHLVDLRSKEPASSVQCFFDLPPVPGDPQQRPNRRNVDLTKMLNQPPGFSGHCHFVSKPADVTELKFGYDQVLWDIEFRVDEEGITNRIESKHWTQWQNFGMHDDELFRIDPVYREHHLAWQTEAARSYYLNRCLMRATNARIAYAQSSGLPYWYEPLYHWRPGRCSYVIPAFEDYCESVGYTCVDKPNEPVQRVPDYVPTGKLWSEIRILKDE